MAMFKVTSLGNPEYIEISEKACEALGIPMGGTLEIEEREDIIKNILQFIDNPSEWQYPHESLSEAIHSKYAIDSYLLAIAEKECTNPDFILKIEGLIN